MSGPTARQIDAALDNEFTWLALRDHGYIDPDAPSPFETERHRLGVLDRWGGEFTELERYKIRAHCGFVDFDVEVRA